MYTDINSEEYQEQFQSGDKGDYQFIDVREIDEYADGRIAGTTNIPLSQFQERVGEITKESPIVLVCAAGGRSAQAADFMLSLGYEDVYNLTDGTKGWISKGYDVES